ncbi:class II aldolase/adducin family protein [Sphingorhabdus sp. Alg239-R122]|uniref:class II aldolase/adducin family protein n=1 Tax=Sphingorhabdus sp. Alg239-R122 TaxID=2305989 RepID=UPI0013DAB832|nr:class II aldolase/adducin family protein [Sphingorhabdus sp. Alg239-R122]
MATAIKTHNEMTTEEREARKLLASCYRVFDMMGWTEMIYNHITLKIPGEEDAFLINPYGLHFSEVCASNLVKINSEGEKLDGSMYPVNKAGFTQHSVFHKQLPDMHCIIHTHTTETMAVCSTEEGLLPTNFYACNFIGQVAYHDFEGVTVRSEEGERLIRNIGDKRVLMLKNHGPVVMGRTLPEAFITYWALQRACEIQLATLSMGKPIIVPQDVIDVHQRDINQTELPGGPGAPDFAAMVRKIDKIDTSWRD